MPMQYVWLIVMIIAAIVEAATAQLVSIWIVAGGLAGLMTSFMTDNIFIQCGVFVAVLIISVLVFMPIVKKSRYFKKTPTNADRCIGKRAIVIEEINNVLGKGQVNVFGNIWTARSRDESVIEKGERVIIDRISGAKLIVSRYVPNKLTKEEETNDNSNTYTGSTHSTDTNSKY